MTSDGDGEPTTLRPATPADVDDHVRLHRDTIAVAYRDFFPDVALTPSAAILGDQWRADVDGAHEVTVAVDGSGVVGSVVARPGGELARLHVHPTRWRAGIGQRLHDRAVDVLRTTGYPEARLWVIDRNEPARRLYERAGWRLVRSEELVELGVTEVRYRRPL